MIHKRTSIIALLSILVICSLACNLLDKFTGGSNTNNEPSDSSSESVDMETLVNDVNVPSQRSDNDVYDEDKFIAHSFPVEVVFNGEETADVIYAGGYYIDDMNTKPPAPQWLTVEFVLQKSYPDFLTIDSGTNIVKMNVKTISYTMDLFDANGNPITNDFRSGGDLYPNLVQAFEATAYGNMENVASAKINISFNPMTNWMEDAFSEEDLDFTFPQALFAHSPVKYYLNPGKMSAQYEQEGVMAAYKFNTQNPYNILITGSSDILFIDDDGLLVGVQEIGLYLEPNGLNEGYETNVYLSGVPTKVMVVDQVDDLEELIIASR